MSCQICCGPPKKRLEFCCSTCARNRVYQLRVDYAKVLLEKESAGNQIEDAVAKSEGGVDAHPSRWAIQAAHTRKSQSTAKTQAMRDHMVVLKEEMQRSKEEAGRRRAAISQRRSDAESATYHLAERRDASLGKVQSDIKKLEHKWNRVHDKTAQSRVLLCREVANLYRLRQKTKRRNGVLLNRYALGGVSIVDLRDMNNASPTHITSSISSVAHLLILICHYLSLRLPAEITLPHRDYPLPTIFPPSASYMSSHHKFPGMTPSHSTSTSPVTSRTPRGKPPPRPRPLFLNSPLQKLAKEDPATYTLFLEGVSLLAWDVSWVCKTQGVSVGSETWEDICDIGRNMWQLLVAPPALQRALSGREEQQQQQKKARDTKDVSKYNNAVLHQPESFPRLGHYSHGTAHSFLGSAEGTEYLKTWKVPSPLKIADKLKSTLLGEMTNAEWELVEENEWDEGGGGGEGAHQNRPQDEKTVQVDARHGASNGDVNSTVTAKTVQEEKLDTNGKYAQPPQNKRPKGTNGWTKLRDR